MKKKILVFILLFMNFAMLKVGANNWDYLPKTNNYFDPDNFFLEGELYTWSFNCLHPFRIKENTVYSLVSKSESDHFFNGVNLIFYNRNLEEIERNPQIRARKYRGYGVMEISFTAPVGAYYLSLDFNFEIMSQPPNNPNDLYDNFVIYEGANDSYFDNYQGADYLNIVISENIYGFYRTNINNPLTVGELKNALKAVDYIDGDLTAEIEVIEDTYSLNCDKIGTYYLTFEVIDKAGNRSEFQIYLEIFDDTPPEVSGNNYLVTSPNDLLSLEEIKGFLQVSDNYDFEIELSVLEDEYTSNYSKIGNYKIIFLATDSSGNETTFPLTVEVRDLVAPVITGPAKIRKSYQETLLVEEILKLYSGFDDQDGEVAVSVMTDDYSENMYELGTWNIKLKASDAGGNVSTYEVKVEVYDGRGPVFIISKNKIEIEFLEAGPDLTLLLYQLQQEENLPSDHVLKIIKDEYSENKKNPGTYQVVLAGDNEVYELKLEVKPEVSLETSLNFIEKVWKKITGFFQKVFN
ncbi:MAG TPA: DUF5011 domain-containing protein [Acholeplasmataceae bacterium]|nr:DUF5011 domain-containing protein [Acholeplasmataceae bacterium]